MKLNFRVIKSFDDLNNFENVETLPVFDNFKDSEIVLIFDFSSVKENIIDSLLINIQNKTKFTLIAKKKYYSTCYVILHENCLCEILNFLFNQTTNIYFIGIIKIKKDISMSEILLKKTIFGFFHFHSIYSLLRWKKYSDYMIFVDIRHYMITEESIL